ncbi:MAG: deoxynucleoside kinase [Solirubrobacteraceae bacterium]
MHISIAGNIGAGKTTLTAQLAKYYKWFPLYEVIENNPYLDDFYNDMSKWSFNLQIYFLGERFKQLKSIKEQKKNVIQDRTIYEDAFIFASNLHDMGLLQTRDFENYLTIYNIMSSFIEPPDLLIYLRCSIAKLVEQIHKRGREFETSINIEYLNRLNVKYEDWIANYKGKILIIDIDNLDFVQNKNDLGIIINKIEAEINGLF